MEHPTQVGYYAKDRFREIQSLGSRNPQVKRRTRRKLAARWVLWVVAGAAAVFLALSWLF